MDLDHDPSNPTARGFGWFCDDNRPILTLNSPRPGRNDALTKIVVGMHDYYSGLDLDSFTVTADFAVDGVAAGENLAAKFRGTTQGVWELKLAQPIASLARGQIVVSIKDKQGNTSRIERTLQVSPNVAGR